jgi:hypothetical protein
MFFCSVECLKAVRQTHKGICGTAARARSSHARKGSLAASASNSPCQQISLLMLMDEWYPIFLVAVAAAVVVVISGRPHQDDPQEYACFSLGLFCLTILCVGQEGFRNAQRCAVGHSQLHIAFFT